MKPSCLPSDWIGQQYLIRDELIQARGSLDPAQLGSLINRVLSRYEAYYRARFDVARSDPVRACSCPLATNLERATYWMSGWRPNILIQLLYTESGFKFEAQLNELLSGAHSGDIGDISPSQLLLIDELQRRTIEAEVEIDEELGRIQEMAPDPFLPWDSDLDLKLEELGNVIIKADELRMRTLRGVVGILDPLQAVDLLVAAADLDIGVRGLGLELVRSPICSWR